MASLGGRGTGVGPFWEMPSQRLKGDPVIELYELLLQNPSILGRVIQVSNLWSPETSRYERDLPDRFRTAEVDKAIARWHQSFFREWLALPLRQKEADVLLHWNAPGSGREQGKRIRDVGQAAIPPLVHSAERDLFLQDLSFIQALLPR